MSKEIKNMIFASSVNVAFFGDNVLEVNESLLNMKGDILSEVKKSCEFIFEFGGGGFVYIFSRG